MKTKIQNLAGEFNLGKMAISAVFLLANLSVYGQTINEAVDNDDLVFETFFEFGQGSGQAWFGQTDVSNDGIDALEAKDPGFDRAILQTTIEGPKTLSFFWRCVGDNFSGSVQLRRGDNFLGSISAKTDGVFEAKSVDIPNGSHVIKWQFNKFGNVQGFLDQIVVSDPAPGTDARIIDNISSFAVRYVGEQREFVVSAFGEPPLTFNWFKDSSPFFSGPESNLTLLDLSVSSAGTYRVEAVGATGNPGTSGNSTLYVLDPDPAALQDAVENETLTLSTNGSALFGRQILDSVEDGDAARSGFPEFLGYSDLIADVTGPAVLRFQVAFSTRTDRSFFEILDNGALRYQNSGNFSNFAEQTLGVGDGQHEIIFRYNRNTSSTSTEFVAIDKIEILPENSGVPAFSLEPPEFLDLIAGQTLTLTANAVGGDEIFYQWQKDGVDIPGADEPTFQIVSTTTDDTGKYRCIATIVEVSATSRETDVFFFDSVNPFAPTLDDETLDVSVGGDQPWFPQRQMSNFGDTAMQAGPIGPGEHSEMSITATGPAEVKFRWLVQSENQYDILYFRIDGIEVDRFSGSFDSFRFKTFRIGSGEHTLTWSYEKDSAVDRFADTGWVDRVEILPLAEDSLPVLRFFPVDQHIRPGRPLALSVEVKDDFEVAGFHPFSVVWKKDGSPIPGATSSTYNILSASEADAGTYTVEVTNPAGTVTAPAFDIRVEDDPSQDFVEIMRLPTSRDIMTLLCTDTELIGLGENVAINSPDGIDWSATHNAFDGARILDVVFLPANGAPAEYVASASRGNIFTSPDGVNWTRQEVDSTADFKGLAYCKDRLIAVGDIAFLEDSTIFTRERESTEWIKRELPFGLKDMWDIACSSDDKLVAVGDDGYIAVSTDFGLTWERLFIPGLSSDEDLKSVMFNTLNQVLVAGDNGTIALFDFDGSNVSFPSVPVTDDIFHVFEADSGLYAFGENGAILFSNDNGANWSNESGNTSNALYSAKTVDGTITAVGAKGTILQKADAAGGSWIEISTGSTASIVKVVSAPELGGVIALNADGELFVNGDRFVLPDPNPPAFRGRFQTKSKNSLLIDSFFTSFDVDQDTNTLAVIQNTGNVFEVTPQVDDIREGANVTDRGVFSAYVDVNFSNSFFQGGDLLTQRQDGSLFGGPIDDIPNQMSVDPGVSSSNISGAQKVNDQFFLFTFEGQSFTSPDGINFSEFSSPFDLAGFFHAFGGTLDSNGNAIFDGEGGVFSNNGSTWNGPIVTKGFNSSSSSSSGSSVQRSGDNVVINSGDSLTTTIRPDGSIERSGERPEEAFMNGLQTQYTSAFSYDADGNLIQGSSNGGVLVPQSLVPGPDMGGVNGTINEDNTFTVFNSDTFPGQPLPGLTEISSTPSHGSVSVDDNGTPNDAADDSFTYTPVDNFFGLDTFTYTINDADPKTEDKGGTVSIDILPINDGPINSVPGSQIINEDDSLLFSGTDTLSISDIDAGDDEVKVTLSVNNGTLNPSLGHGASVTGNETSNVDIQGTISQVNNTLGGLTYNPTQHFNGSDTLTITTNDQTTTGGDPLSDTDTINITINPVNDAPVNTVPGPQTLFSTDTLTFSSDEGNPLSVSDIDSDTLEVSISVNDGTLTITPSGSSSVTDNGTNSVSISGPVIDINNTLNGLTYTPPSGFIGENTLTFISTDPGTKSDTDEVSLTVTPPQVPFAASDFFTIPEDTPTNLPVLNNDAAPGTGENTLNIRAINDTPVDSGPITTANGTVSLNEGQLLYTPDTSFFGIETFTYTIESTPDAGDGPHQGNVTIDVEPINDPPVNVVPGPLSIDEDNPLSFTDRLSITDNNSGDDVLSVELSVGNGTLSFSTDGGASVSGNETSSVVGSGQLSQLNVFLNSLVYTPKLHFNGETTLTITTNDNHSIKPREDADTVNITISPVNDAPVLVVPGKQTFFTDFDNRFSSDNGNEIQIDDVDAGEADVQVDLTIGDGTLTLSSNEGVTVESDVPNSLRITGTVNNINNAIGGKSIHVQRNSAGTDFLSISVNDLGGTGSGGAQTENVQVEIEFLNLSLLDTDGDKMTDAFELRNFNSRTGGEPDGDNDNDGESNIKEFITGSNPIDGRSRFNTVLQRVEADLTIKVNSLVGRNYTLETTTDFVNFNQVETIAGTGGEITFQDLNVSDKEKFYRIRVSLPE